MRSLPAAALSLLLILGTLSASAPAEDELKGFLDSLEASWRSHDESAYLALWDFESPERRDQEAEFAKKAVTDPSAQLVMQRPTTAAEGDQSRVFAQVLYVTGRTASVEQWSMTLKRREKGWAIVGRIPAGRLDGLVHLSLDEAGYRADGLALNLEDFRLQMTRGTIFTSTQDIGPTALVFVGEGVLRFKPRPDNEREQLRQFWGQEELVQRVSSVFVRISPDALSSCLEPYRLEADPESGRHRADAQRVFRDHVGRSFVLDGTLPGSPWWVVPLYGDSLVNFDAGKHGALTYAVSSANPESVSLFDKVKRLQICLYASEGRSQNYSEDDTREAETLDHHLSVRFAPNDSTLQGTDTLRLRLRTSSSNLRLRLDGALRVDSVTSKEGSHLVFRVRGQDSLMVSLGPASGAGKEVALTVRFGGAFSPAPVDSEVQGSSFGGGALMTTPPGLTAEEPTIENVQVFSSRNAWYPQVGTDSFSNATMRLMVPAGYMVLSGGELVASHVGEDEVMAEYRSGPSKYLSAVVGRIHPVGSRKEGPLEIDGYGIARTGSDAQQLLDRATQIVRFFVEKFGPCPYKIVRLVVIEGQTPGGHSPPGMVILARRPRRAMTTTLAPDPANFEDVPDFFLAHELAHQWWGQGVAPENYRERWLAEGAAQYAAALWVERSQGVDAFHDVLKRMGRWAADKSGSGPINLGSRIGHVASDPYAYRAVVYDKGAYVLHMLRGLVGDDAFFGSLRALQQDKRFMKVGTDDLRSSLEAASGKDLAPYLRQWVYETGIPRIHFSEHAIGGSGGFKTDVEIHPERLPGPLPLEIAALYDSGRELSRVIVPPEGGHYTLETPKPVRKVEINVDRGLLLAQ